jgi:hypothetical protein
MTQHFQNKFTHLLTLASCGALCAPGCGANTEDARDTPSSVEQGNADETAGENSDEPGEPSATSVGSEPEPTVSEPEPSASAPSEPETAAGTDETSNGPETSSEPEPAPNATNCAERPLESCTADGDCAISSGFPYDASGECFSTEPVALACVDASLFCPPIVTAGLDAAGMCYSFGNCLPEGFQRAADDNPCVAALATQCNSAVPAVPEECRSACELAAGECPEQKFLDLDPTRDEFADPEQCGSATLFAVEGLCADGRPFLYRGTGFTTEVRYFTSGGSFLALSTTTDVISEPCFGQSYWPEPVACPDAVVSDVLCGTTFAPGDAVSLPFSSADAR